jgi:hypothetical protein
LSPGKGLNGPAAKQNLNAARYGGLLYSTSIGFFVMNQADQALNLCKALDDINITDPAISVKVDKLKRSARQLLTKIQQLDDKTTTDTAHNR